MVLWDDFVFVFVMFYLVVLISLGFYCWLQVRLT